MGATPHVRQRHHTAAVPPSRHPDAPSTRPLIDKLGVKPGARVAIVGLNEPFLLDLLAQRIDDVSEGDLGDDGLPAWKLSHGGLSADEASSTGAEGPLDLVFFGAESLDDLGRLPALRAHLNPDGAIWVVSLKGKAATLRDVDVIAAAIAAGLVDNKVVNFSETHTALRLVIPLALRPPAERRPAAPSPPRGKRT